MAIFVALPEYLPAHCHDDVIKWKHFPLYWPFVKGIHWGVTGGFPSQRSVKRSFDVFMVCTRTNSWGNSRDAGDLRRHMAHYDVTVMPISQLFAKPQKDLTLLLTRRGFYSLSGLTSYRKISWSFEAARSGFRLFRSLWNLTGTSTAPLPLLRDLGAIRWIWHPISRLWDFMRFGGKMLVRLVIYM